MEPYAYYRKRVLPEPGTYSHLPPECRVISMTYAPEPQEHIVDFRSGCEISPQVAKLHVKFAVTPKEMPVTSILMTASKDKYDQTALAKRRNNLPTYYVCSPKCQADVDELFVQDPDIVELVMSPRDLSTFNKSFFASNRVVLGDPTHVEVTPTQRRCTCDDHVDSPCPACFPERARLYRDDGRHPLDPVSPSASQGCRVPGCGKPCVKQFDVEVRSGTFDQPTTAPGHEEYAEYVRGSCCSDSDHRSYYEAGLKEECVAAAQAWHIEHDLFRGNADFSEPADDKPDAIIAAVTGATRILPTIAELDAQIKAENKCECGAAATGVKPRTPGHSSWCPAKG